MNIQPIQTWYRGCKFRSRLEARWAVFLDALRVRWTYELQGFNLDGRPYLPDFWVSIRPEFQRSYPQGSPPERGFWVEIKPVDPLPGESIRAGKVEVTDALPAEMRLCGLLARDTGHCVYLVAGNVGDGEFTSYKWHPKHCADFFFIDRSPSYTVKCLDLITFNKFIFYLMMECVDRGDEPRVPTSRLWNAFQAARSARFEHGESPII
jgi:hypothetical protein